MARCLAAWAVTFLCATAFAVDYQISVPGVGPLVGGPSRFDGIAGFLGVPYAKAPTGDRRWQPPQEHEAWQTPRSAKAFGSECVQGFSGTEDCLFLNVYTPTSELKSQKKLPVMFWIHGGSYQTGAGSAYEGDALVHASSQSMLVVTINYRLNVFGFLCGQEIKSRTSDHSCGNFGIQDQRFAMAWVSKHIGTFGGDSSAVTIFGESAGGNSVFNHLAQPASFKYYKKAIIESGAYNLGATTIKAASAGYASMLSATKCSDLDCLLKKSTLQLRGKGSGRGPVVDGVNLVATPSDLIKQGKHNKEASVILGSNRDEDASPWFDYDPKQMTEKQFDAKISGDFGSKALTKIKQLYDKSVYPYPKNLGSNSIWWWTASRISTDSVPGLGACGTRWLAKNLLNAGTSNVYTYLFAHPEQKKGGIPGSGPGSVISPHAIEIAYVYDAEDQMNKGEEADLAKKMSNYWINFAVTGNPNDAKLPKWPKYALDTDYDLRFDVGADGIVAEQHLRKAACDYWESEFFCMGPHCNVTEPSTETVIV